MDGSDKRVPLIIGRACRPRCFNGSHGSDMGYNYFWNTKAWMTSPIWNIFLTELNADMQHQAAYFVIMRQCAITNTRNTLLKHPYRIPYAKSDGMGSANGRSPGVLDSHPNTTLELETALLEQAAGLPHLAQSVSRNALGV
ncbi:tigger transposable element derived-like protein [Rhizoctonia solani]|uniref:Tigger transposable element derived-like protein n=1 Tax=Rhizoctonia solani TaxID=456999 RepID=A0A8H8SZG2_9AGAM|nr:tigger transposable element derived-like protein [Rhizoctonia solani]QRW23394.1 tigger transposable element derived-like protein [Rhizoctonia solani]